MEENVKVVLAKYNEGLADPAEVKQLEKWLEEGIVDLAQLTSLQAVTDQVMKLEAPDPSMDMDDKFYQMLKAEKQKVRTASWTNLFSWPQAAPRWALASLLVAVGIGVGYWLKPSGVSHQQVEVLTQQVTDLKEMMMFSLLEKESATDRLKAVSLAHEMSAGEKVTAALIQTLNNDENINVRLAALEALKPYTRESSVREALVKSIAQQQSPLVQVALAELMVALQEKSSVEELKKILEREQTPAEVKKRIEESINVMI